jgi:hypothetical protein
MILDNEDSKIVIFPELLALVRFRRRREQDVDAGPVITLSSHGE